MFENLIRNKRTVENEMYETNMVICDYLLLLLYFKLGNRKFSSEAQQYYESIYVYYATVLLENAIN